LEEPVSYLIRFCLLTFEKLALTVLFSVNAMEHGPVPVQLPDHPENFQPFSAMAVSVSRVSFV
jgi:hypothetical protein